MKDVDRIEYRGANEREEVTSGQSDLQRKRT